MGVLRIVLACVVGYLLGSVLPAALIARARGVDIRTVGDGNPGTVNAFKGLGLAAGLLTAAYDLSVGLVALGVARLLGSSEGWSYMAGVMAVVGHRFPAFHDFRGGQAMAASVGLLLYALGVSLVRGWLTPLGVALLAAALVAVFALTRSDRAASLVMLPLLLMELALGRADWRLFLLAAAVAGNIWFVQLAAWRSRAPAMRGHPQR